MRSHAERRRAVEWALRVALLVTLAVAFWRSLDRHTSGASSATLSASTPGRGADAIIANPAITSLDVSVDAMPSRADRDLLVALRHAGVHVRWHGTPPAIAIEADRAREPDARARILVKTDAVAALALRDSVGLVDSTHANNGATLDAESTVGPVRAEQGSFVASVRTESATARGSVLVLGRADWESKFVLAALTEAGWNVRARISAAPGVLVHDDAILPIDTSRYDAVVMLDTSATDLASAIARFVAQGGGLVVSGGALATESVRAFAPAAAEERRAGRILLADDSITPRDLPVRPLASLRSDALALDRESAGITVAARRVGLGRVLAVGYDELWRWRMLGGTSGLDAHRRWWSSAVGSVAPERISTLAPSTGDAAPLAALISALGTSSSASSASAVLVRNPLPIILLVVIAIALFAETASRRLRSAP